MVNEKVIELTLPDEIQQSFEASEQQQLIRDYQICCISREVSFLARKDVLTGKAKFGITGDGKELPQVVMAQHFQPGDYRAGYYRDQTFVFSLGLCTVEEYFAHLYADTNNDPFSGGRQMNNHFATPFVDKDGKWTRHKERYNITSDISSTAGQMGRALGLALASKVYRQKNANNKFSQDGNEVIFCSIGDASTSEGIFWESINAAAVQQVPLAVFVYDDGYGISVPTEYQTTKGSISAALAGFASKKKGEGISLYQVDGSSYEDLQKVISTGIDKVRKEHKPAVFHIQKLTQPQGHSTSGSHERYKSKERLNWEKENDCLKRLEEYLLANEVLDEDDITVIRLEAKKYVKEHRNIALEQFVEPTKAKAQALQAIYQELEGQLDTSKLNKIFAGIGTPLLSELVENARQLRFLLRKQQIAEPSSLTRWLNNIRLEANQNYGTHLYAEDETAAIRIANVPPLYDEESPKVNGFEVLNAFFDHQLSNNPDFLAFGEDLGFIGGVNQGFAGLQEKHGEEKVFDTGIREWTIMGQAIGMAMRGLRPIGEIQYLDYLIYGLEPLVDDLATLRWRSNGQQISPAIIRTRGHRLEGIWHSGSPMGMMIHSLRGMHVCVPRNMVQAAGMYKTLLQSSDPGIIVECLNGYRLKETLPSNIGEYTVPLGVPEILQLGQDITLVTYGSCVRIAQKAMAMLAEHGISVELIDVQTLLPFDLEHRIVDSLKKTNRILFLDEDVPGGATAYMMQEVLEVQNGYRYLDSAPKCLSAKAHRPAYGSDGDYFSKPNVEDVFEAVYEMIKEAEPNRLF